jgi:nucleoside-diphosphate-sugar epimerase
MVRPVHEAAGGAIAYDLSVPVDPQVLRGIDVLVHCAYDMTLTSRRRIWEVNVAGTDRLLAAAREAGIRRCIVISSIAAFPGTRQLYGEAKLAVERAALQYGAVVVRPGLVFGPRAGGMVGALRRSLSFPIVPLLAGRSKLYLVHEDDLANAVIALAITATSPAEPVVVAHPDPVSPADLLHAMAKADSRRLVLVPVPWRLAFLALSASGRLGVRLRFRADSLWGLAHPPPPPSVDAIRRLGIRPRKFAMAFE